MPSASNGHPVSTVQSWGSPTALRIFAYVYLALAPVAMAAIIWATLTGVRGFEDDVAAISMPPILIGTAAFYWVLANRPRLSADDRGVTIRNLFAERRLDWEQITKITPGYWGIEFARGDREPPVIAMAVQKSNLSKVTGHQTRADHVARVLAQRAAHGGQVPEAFLPDATGRATARRNAIRVMVLGLVLIVARIVIEFI
jgi:hypothetical protein